LPYNLGKKIYVFLRSAAHAVTWWSPVAG
jgi:hypothetical protein